MKPSNVTIQIDEWCYFHVELFIILYQEVLAYESLDEILNLMLPFK